MSNPKGKNILIVDNDKDITNLFKTFLEYDGYKVDTLLILLMLYIHLEKLYIHLEKMYMILLYLI